MPSGAQFFIDLLECALDGRCGFSCKRLGQNGIGVDVVYNHHAFVALGGYSRELVSLVAVYFSCWAVNACKANVRMLVWFVAVRMVIGWLSDSFCALLIFLGLIKMAFVHCHQLWWKTLEALWGQSRHSSDVPAIKRCL